MPFCRKCGTKLEEGVNFCPNCGSSNSTVPEISKNQNDNISTERKQSYVGTIKKCPNCNSVLKGFSGICPECGFEIEKKSSESIQEFTNKIVELDSEIAKESKPINNFWTSWNNSQKIGFVLLNIFTLGLALLIYIPWLLIKPLFQNIFGLKNNNNNNIAAVNNKISYIENYMIPNTKDDYMEFILFASSQRDRDYSNDYEAKKLWTSVWNSKLEQIINKASVYFSKDADFIALLDEQKRKIIESKKDKRIFYGILKKIQRAIISILAILFIIICIIAVVDLYSKETSSTKPEVDSTSIEVEVSE